MARKYLPFVGLVCVTFTVTSTPETIPKHIHASILKLFLRFFPFCKVDFDEGVSKKREVAALPEQPFALDDFKSMKEVRKLE